MLQESIRLADQPAHSVFRHCNATRGQRIVIIINPIGRNEDLQLELISEMGL